MKPRIIKKYINKILYMYRYILLKSYPKGTISLGVQKRKDRRVGMKRKWWVLAQPPYSLQGNGRQSPKVEPFKHEDRPLYAEENPGSRCRQRLGRKARARAHSRYIHVKQENHERRPLNPQQLNTDAHQRQG